MSKSLADILGSHDESSDSEDSPDYDKSGQTAAEDFIAAVKSSDASKAWEAFKTMDGLCEKAESGKSDKPDDESDGEGSHAALMLIPHSKS